MPSHEVIDTLGLARRELPGVRSHRLDTLARLLGLGLGDSHRALADSLRVKDLWLHLEGVGAEGVESYPVHDPAGPSGNGPPLGWDSLVDAAARGLRVRVEYAGGTRGNAPRELTPRRFAHRGGVAFVVALCHLDGVEKSFRLDRFVRYEILAPA